VLGAIGTPTGEMFVASWNAKREVALTKGDTTTYNIKLAFVPNSNGIGYYLNDITESNPAKTNTVKQTITTTDKLYVWNDYAPTRLASPNGSAEFIYGLHQFGEIIATNYPSTYPGVRPVVCLSADIPAKLGSEGTTDFVI
jgi:hypothetical protein